MASNTTPTFLIGTGKAILPLSNSLDYGQSVVQQSDGRLVLAGYSLDSSYIGDFSLMRLNTDGSLDTSFGSAGKTTIPVGSYNDRAYAVIQQSDGKLLLAGHSDTDSGRNFSIVRLNANGSLDTGFGSGGKVIFSAGSTWSEAASIIQLTDGKLIVLGNTDNGNNQHRDFSVIRLNTNGSVDTSFAAAGQVIIPLPGLHYNAYSLIQQADGKFVLTGGGFDGEEDTDRDFLAVRLHSNGSLDTGFGTNGIVSVDAGSAFDLGRSVVQQTDEKLVLAGTTLNTTDFRYDFSLVRLHTDGSADTSFGNGGKVIISVGGADDMATCFIQQSDGKLVVAGYSDNGSSNYDYSIVRLHANGNLDTSFGTGGKAIITVGAGTSLDVAYSLIQQSDGKLVLAGQSNDGSKLNFSIARLNTDGSLDRTFNLANTLDASAHFTEGSSPVVLDASVVVTDAELGSLNAGAGNYSGSSITLARSGGAHTQDIFSGSGNLTFAGRLAVLSGETVGTLTHSNGTLTLTFNTAATQAKVNTVLSSIAYANTSDAPPDSVQIDWTFSDGNVGNQGTGGAQTITGTTRVYITPVNDSPLIQGLPASPQTVDAGKENTLVDFTVTDADGADVPLTVTLTVGNGMLGGVRDANTSLPGIQLSGTAAQINAAIAGATFTAQSGGPASIGISVSDGIATPVMGMYNLTANAVNTAPTFLSNGGKAIIPVGSLTDQAWALTQQTDGKLVLAGYSVANSNMLSVVRLNHDGSLDTGFGVEGKVLASIIGKQDHAYAVIQQGDGKLVLAGHSWNGSNWDMGIARLNTDGSPDTSFGSSGKTVISVPDQFDVAYSLMQLADGRLILAGSTNLDYRVVRLHADGSLDNSFGVGGIVDLPVGNNEDVARSVIQQADGKLILAGYSYSASSNFDFSLVRLNTNGTLDTSFGSGGKTTIPIGSIEDLAMSAIQQADGRLVLAGYSATGANFDFSLIRLTANGNLDTDFANGGKLTIAVGSSNDHAYSVIQQADGKLVLAGIGRNSDNNDDYAVVRIHANGTIDTSFGTAGKLLLPVGPGKDIARSIIQQADGKLVLAGYSTNINNNDDFSIIRLNPDGSLDDSFNASQTVNNVAQFTQGGSPVVLDASVVLTDAELTALNSGAGNYAGSSITLARAGGANAQDVFSGSGALSLTGSSAVLSGTTVGSVSNSGGTLTIAFNAAATQAVVNQTLSSIAYANTSDTPPASVQIDWSFNDGNTGSQGSGGALGATGTTTVNITAVDNTAPTFLSNGGKAVITVGGGSWDEAYSVIQQADGKLVLAGRSLESNFDFGLVRLNANGSLDTSFGTSGKVILSVGTGKDELSDIIQLPDGKLLAIGYTAINDDWDYSVVRLHADGSQDTSFGSGGKLIMSLGASWDVAKSVVRQSDGKLVLAGYSADASNTYDFSLMRLNADGTPDTSFGNAGQSIIPVGNDEDVASSVIQQADGKLVLAGYSLVGGNSDFSLVRLNTDGSLDTGFGTGGKTFIAVGSSTDAASCVIQQADGKLVLAGYSHNGSNYDYSIVRLNANGSLDTGFGSGGKAIIPVGTSHSLANTVIQLSNGKLLVGGDNFSGTNRDFSVVRLNANGSLDTSFGVAGKIIVPISTSHEYAKDMIVQADGKLVLLGSSTDGSVRFSIIRLNPDGSLDDSFNASQTVNNVAQFTQGGSPVVLDVSVVLTDAELTALNSGAGNYAGSSITLARAGGANAQDVFSGSGALSLTGSSAVLSGTTVGSVSNSGGTLTIAFNAAATQAVVNQTLSSIAYANTSDTPPASVQIDWSFNDGNTGSQGSGGALGATGTTTVNITAVDNSVIGTSGPDTLNGTANADTLSGLGGNDTLNGGAGADSLDGGSGTDTASYADATTPVSVILYGGQAFGVSSGNDTLTAIENILGTAYGDLIFGDAADNVLDGGAGNDTLDGALGNDTLLGQTGDDLLNGLAGNDSLDGGDGNDTLFGWADNDTLVGGTGTDRLFGGAGADRLDGGADADQLEGDDGADTLLGGAGNDTLRGWNDADSLDGGDGDNALFGGAGADSMQAGTGADQLEGDDGNDTLQGAVGDDTLRGWNDNDSMDGGDGNDALFGGAGADAMQGAAGNDQLEGDDGNDTIAGGTGNDTLRGWNDSDNLSGDDGDDLLVGWSGNDAMNGGAGNDQLFGDDGADTLVGGAGGDVLQGGLGNDVYVFATGFGFDGVRDYDYLAGNSDTFQFTGINRADLSFARVGDALKVERTASAGADVIYVNDWYQAGSNGAYRIETWVMGDGSYTALQIEVLVV